MKKAYFNDAVGSYEHADAIHGKDAASNTGVTTDFNDAQGHHWVTEIETKLEQANGSLTGGVDPPRAAIAQIPEIHFIPDDDSYYSDGEESEPKNQVSDHNADTNATETGLKRVPLPRKIHDNKQGKEEHRMEKQEPETHGNHEHESGNHALEKHDIRVDNHVPEKHEADNHALEKHETDHHMVEQHHSKHSWSEVHVEEKPITEKHRTQNIGTSRSSDHKKALRKCTSLDANFLLNSSSVESIPEEAETETSPNREVRKKKPIDEIRHLKGNEVCADCGFPNPDWASTNLGITICSECSCIHRTLGTKYSRVKSLDFDFWDLEQIKLLKLLGNTNVNETYLRYYTKDSLPTQPGPTSTKQHKEVWIKAKYVDRCFAKQRNDKTTSSYRKKWHYSNENPVSSQQSHARFSSMRAGKASSQMNNKTKPEEYELNEAEARELIEAAQTGDINKLANVLAKGVDCNYSENAKDRIFTTPLHQAMISGSSETSEYLLQNGARVNVLDGSEQTPLHLACIHGHTNQALQLLKRHAQFNLKDKEGLTPLDIAMNDANADIVTLLRLQELKEDLNEIMRQITGILQPNNNSHRKIYLSKE